MFDKLIKLVRQEKVSLFIGSGFSIEAGIPSVPVLKKLILDEIENDKLRKEHENDNLDTLSEFFVNESCAGSRNELISIMKKAFEFEPKCMDDHRTLASIPHFRTIFTTNYDTLLEDSYNDNECNIVRNDVDCTYMDKRLSIYKVHGDFTAPHDIVITTSDYNKYKKSTWPNPIMWNHVISEFSQKHILFIGYSLYDDNILEIITRIAKRVGKNQKQMFLIAPNLSTNQQARLKKMSVTYYDACAKEFLDELHKNLSEHISEDFRHRKVSPETFARFCHNHKYDPTISLGVKSTDSNRINGINPLPGEKVTHKLEMTISSAIKEKIASHDFEKYGEYLKENTIYRGVPFIRLAGEDLIKCSHDVNGVVLNDKIASVLIGPAEQKIDMGIRIPCRNFFKQVQARGYRLNDHKLLLYVDCHIYDMAINVEFNEGTTTFSFNFDFRKKYKDNDEALIWIELIIAFFSNDEVFLNSMSSTLFRIKNDGKIPEFPFNEYKQYYQNIREIEMLTGQKFSQYNECTKDNYDSSIIVLAYLKHEYLTVRHNEHEGLKFSTRDIEDNEFTDEVKVNDDVSIVSTSEGPQEYTINDRTFSIQYVYEVYDSCTVKAIKTNEQGKVEIDFFYPKEYYQILYSDKSVKNEYPHLKMLKKITS